MRLVLCDDNRIFCEALALVLEARGHRALAIALTADAGVAAVAAHRPDACLMDLHFPNGGDGLQAVRTIRERCPETAVLVMSGLSDPAVSSTAMQLGVAGFLSKDQELDQVAAALDMIEADRMALTAGSSPGPDSVPGPPRPTDLLSRLTPRETEVLRRIAAGQDTKTMVREMNVTTETLRTYVKNVFAKLGAHSRLEAAALASLGAPSGHIEPDRDHPWLAALTPREREVLLYLMKGFGLPEVAKQLHMSSRTVHTHLQNLRSKLGVHSTLEAVTLARSRLDERSEVGAGAT
jgi:two-component system, NarL family, nitrate/nitrite response regulator NarL